MVLWYLTRVRGATELGLAFASMIGDLVGFAGLVVAAAFMRDAFVTDTPRTRGRLALAGLVAVGMVALVCHLIYVGF